MRTEFTSITSSKPAIFSKSLQLFSVVLLCTVAAGCSMDNMRVKQPIFGANGEKFGQNPNYAAAPVKQKTNYAQNNNWFGNQNYNSSYTPPVQQQQFSYNYQNQSPNYNSYMNSEVTGSLGNNISSQALAPVHSTAQQYSNVQSYTAPSSNVLARPAPRPQWNAGPTGVIQPVSNSGIINQSALAGAVQVQQGEDIHTIARRYNVQTEALLSANNLNSGDQIQPGQMLNLPSQNWNNLTEKPVQKVKSLPNYSGQGTPSIQNNVQSPQGYRPPAVQYEPWKRSSKLNPAKFVQLAQNGAIMNDAAPVFIGAIAPRPATRPAIPQNTQNNVQMAQASPQYSIHEGKAGETYASIAKQYGLSPSIVSHSNGSTPSGQIVQGQKIVIPGLNSNQMKMLQAANSKAANDNEIITGSVQSVNEPNQFKDAPQKIIKKQVPAVQKPENISKPKAEKTVQKSVPKAVTILKTAESSIAKPKVEKTAKIAPTPAPRALQNAPSVAASSKGIVANDNDPMHTGSIPTKQALEKVEKTQDTAAASSLKFRWPAKGRVISSFGSKTTSGSNEGINIAVPEGTPVKAAEDGIVAYTGNELKGYGNLVLISHANGIVTAYAHNSEILVKKGEKVSRGQAISKAGQTGAVNQPQIHFEIRKSSQPVDPMGYLSNS